MLVFFYVINSKSLSKLKIVQKRKYEETKTKESSLKQIFKAK